MRPWPLLSGSTKHQQIWRTHFVEQYRYAWGLTSDHKWYMFVILTAFSHFLYSVMNDCYGNVYIYSLVYVMFILFHISYFFTYLLHVLNKLLSSCSSVNSASTNPRTTMSRAAICSPPSSSLRGPLALCSISVTSVTLAWKHSSISPLTLAS